MKKNRISYFNYFLVVLGFLYACSSKKQIYQTNFHIKQEQNEFHVLDSKQELSYVFEKYYWVKSDTSLSFKAILYKDIVLSSPRADSLRAGVKDVQILLLKHDKHNKFSLVKQIGKTNCYGQFDFYASPSTSGLYLAFVKDEALNIAYSVDEIFSNVIGSSTKDLYLVDTICR